VKNELGRVRLDCAAWNRLVEMIHRPAYDDESWVEPIVNAWSALLPAAKNLGLLFRYPEADEAKAGHVVEYETGFSIVAHAAPGVVIVLYALHSERVTLGAFERRLFKQIAIYLENTHPALTERPPTECGGKNQMTTACDAAASR
jgi:hypothetical protein